MTIAADLSIAPTLESVMDNVGSLVGVIPENGATDDTRLVLSGAAEPGATVAVFDGADRLGTVPAGPAGLWRYTTGELSSGITHDFKATVRDAAGNTAAGEHYPVTIDAVAPDLTIAAGQTRFKAGETARVTFTFSELPKGFDAEDVAVAGGSLSALTAGPGKVYTALFTPAGANNLKGSNVVAVGSYTDAVGNAGTAGNSPTLAGDTLAPSLTLRLLEGKRIARDRCASCRRHILWSYICLAAKCSSINLR